MSDAGRALIKLLEDGPPYERLDVMADPTGSARVQYNTWFSLRIRPLLADLLGQQQGSTTFAGNVSAGRDVAGGDIQQQ